jgi:hypothetical protein
MEMARKHLARSSSMGAVRSAVSALKKSWGEEEGCQREW